MTSNVLDQIVKRSRRLYSLPAVAMQVVELTNQQAVDAQALKDCIENDPALTTKILRVVNSSLFGLSRQGTDLNQALALIGTKPLKLLVLGFSLPRELQAGLEADILERYWRRTLIKAVAARELAETLWHVAGDDAFIAGLLQDLGMLVLIQDLGDTYITFLNRIYQDGGDVLKLEEETLGFDHVKLSASLLEHWGLPEAIVRDVRRPFKVDVLGRLSDDVKALPQILHMADLVGEFLTRERACLLNELIDVAGHYKGLSIEDLEKLIKSLEYKVPQLADVFSLSLPEDLSYSEVLTRAYGQLCDTAESAGIDLIKYQCSDAPADNHIFDDLLERAQSLQRDMSDVADSPRALPTEPDPLFAAGVHDRHVNGGAGLMMQVVSAPSLLGAVQTSVKTCRQSRQPLSLGLLELDHVEELCEQIGSTRIARAMDRVQPMIHAIVVDDGSLVQIGDYRFAVILEGAERQPAVELTRQLVRCVREWSGENVATLGLALSFSAGVATLAMPPKNFPCQELIDAAERCLNGVQLSGGDSVKSIDIY